MLIVQKFGGTSVEGIERIKASAEIVKNNILKGNQIIVVVSAMAGETDKLISLVRQVEAKDDQTILAEMDSVISTGEQVCAGIFACYLNKIGIKARSFTGMQAGILTDNNHTKAHIEEINLENVTRAMEEGFTPVITGFQGFCTKTGRQTTFGRGGSDTSAIAIAATMKADKCEIYKDVEGVFSGDPLIIKNQKKKPEIDYKTMLEIASSGTKVLELRAVNFASKYNIRTEVRSSFQNISGTSISSQVNERAKIENISISEKEVLAEIETINLPKTLETLNEKSTSFQVISFYKGLLTILVSAIDQSKFSGLKVEQDIAKISIIGVFLKSDKILEKATEILAQSNINPILTLNSETKITFIIKQSQGREMYKKLYDALVN